MGFNAARKTKPPQIKVGDTISSTGSALVVNGVVQPSTGSATSTRGAVVISGGGFPVELSNRIRVGGGFVSSTPPETIPHINPFLNEDVPMASPVSTAPAKASRERITEIPPEPYKALVGVKGQGGIAGEWYNALTLANCPRADRPKIEAALTLVYKSMLDLPEPVFAWLESPMAMTSPADDALTGKVSQLITDLDAALVKAFHAVLGNYYKEMMAKDARSAEFGNIYNLAFDVDNEKTTNGVKPLRFSPCAELLRCQGHLQALMPAYPESYTSVITDQAKIFVPALVEVMQSVFAVTFREKACLIYERPVKIHKEDGPRGLQIHCTTGPAIEFCDGKGQYLLDGIVVPERVVLHPETITIEEIEQNDNIEVRRLMIAQRGVGWYLKETKATVIHEDTVKLFAPHATIDPEDRELTMPRALIKDKNDRLYLCGTDGSTNRVYYMMCPGDVKTCAEAHSRLSGLDEKNCVAQS